MGRVRESENRTLNSLVVIFSDGDTELNYFRCKKSDLKGKRNVRIKLVPVKQKSAAEIVQSAKKYIKNNCGNEPNDKYFCVMDLDHANDADISKALKEKPDKMRLIVSNPDFEFWFLLHYTYHEGSLQNKEPIGKLREYIKDYEKANVEKIYPSLKGKEMDAISHAERLRRFHQNEGIDDLNSVSVNPYTNVDELVSYINSI